MKDITLSGGPLDQTTISVDEKLLAQHKDRPVILFLRPPNTEDGFDIHLPPSLRIRHLYMYDGHEGVFKMTVSMEQLKLAFALAGVTPEAFLAGRPVPEHQAGDYL